MNKLITTIVSHAIIGVIFWCILTYVFGIENIAINVGLATMATIVVYGIQGHLEDKYWGRPEVRWGILFDGPLFVVHLAALYAATQVLTWAAFFVAVGVAVCGVALIQALYRR